MLVNLYRFENFSGLTKKNNNEVQLNQFKSDHYGQYLFKMLLSKFHNIYSLQISEP